MTMMMMRRVVVYVSLLLLLSGAGAAAAASSSKFISIASLKANNVPCSVRGSSYSDCRPASPANIYARACTQYTTCYHNTNL